MLLMGYTFLTVGIIYGLYEMIGFGNYHGAMLGLAVMGIGVLLVDPVD